jgi:hypothetical protein
LARWRRASAFIIVNTGRFFATDGNGNWLVLRFTVKTAQLPPALQLEVLYFVEFLAHRAAPSADAGEQAAAERLRAQGYRHFGIFADDPGALEVFDEIERERDQNTIGAA